MNREMMRAAKAEGRRLVKKGWNDFYEVTDLAIKKHLDLNGGKAQGRLPDQVFQNNVYIVQIFNHSCSWGMVKRAMIRRNDELPEHNWSKIQRIKNEVFGEDAVALEVYPKQRNLIDVANIYWLWILPEGFICPIELSQHS
jgi:hypothetical protein